MPADDFLTNVETAWLTIVRNSDILALYNWERWDSDTELKLPRGRVNVRGRIDPEETPYWRVETEFAFEGRPKKQQFSVIMNELKTILEQTETSDLEVASNNTVKFFGRGEGVTQDRQVMGGLRVWKLSFALYAMPMT